jgi:SAM-dependent methyltransferase
MGGDMSEDGSKRRTNDPASDHPASHEFWERCIRETIDGGIPDKWSESVFDTGNEIALAFLDGLPAGGDVLDFGCGIGRNALALARRGFHALVADVAGVAVRYCEERAYAEGLDDLHSVGYDERELELPNASVDGIMAWSCLDHVTLAHAGELADELGRVARSGALLLLSFDEDRRDDPESECRVLEDGTHQYYEGKRAGMLFRPYTNAEIRGLFEGDWELVRWEGDDVTVPRRALYQRK